MSLDAHLAACRLDNRGHVLFEFWNGARDVQGELFLKRSVCVDATVQHLVHPLHGLNKFASKYVRVPGVLHVRHDLWRNVDIHGRRRPRQFNQVLNERLATVRLASQAYTRSVAIAYISRLMASCVLLPW